jgi:pilus assembly protein Flp/PilA
MATLLHRLMHLTEREEGQGMVEYGLILALVAIVIIVTLTLMGNVVAKVFSNVTAAL